MVDQTGHDIRVGDLAALDDAGNTRGEPRIEQGPALDETRVSRAAEPVAAAAPGTPPARDPRDRALVALAAACGVLAIAAGVAFWQQHRLAQAVAALEARAEQSVEYLENRVASTNSTLRSADAETQKSFDLVAADIGRLNDNLNRAARQAEQQARALAAADASLKALGAELRRVADASGAADAELAARARALADAVDQLAARQKAQGEAVSALQRSGELVTQLRGDVAVLNGSLRELEDAHDRRLRATEQAIASNDAFRRQVNATIDRLTQQVNELYQRR